MRFIRLSSTTAIGSKAQKTTNRPSVTNGELGTIDASTSNLFSHTLLIGFAKVPTVLKLLSLFFSLDNHL